jgi:hypothetical protein
MLKIEYWCGRGRTLGYCRCSVSRCEDGCICFWEESNARAALGLHRDRRISNYFPASKAEVAQCIMQSCGISRELEAVKMACDGLTFEAGPKGRLMVAME